MDRALHGFDTRINGFTGRVERLDGRIETLDQHVDQRFDTIDRRFDTIDQRFDVMEQRFDLVRQEIAGVKEQIAGIKDTIVIPMNAQFDAMRQSIGTNRFLITAVLAIASLIFALVAAAAAIPVIHALWPADRPPAVGETQPPLPPEQPDTAPTE